MRLTAVVILISSCLSSFSAHAQEGIACQDRTEKALQAWDFARKVYVLNNRGFLAWVSCSSTDFKESLGTALHEQLHLFGFEGRNLNSRPGSGIPSWILPSEENIQRPGGHNTPRELFKPKSISHAVHTMDPDYRFYLTGEVGKGEEPPSSAEDFNFMLDELNSYTADTMLVYRLLKTGGPVNSGGSVDGLMALMVMTRAYLSEAQRAHARAWTRLNQPDYKGTIQKMWSHAESALGQICEYKEKVQYLKWNRELREVRRNGALEVMLGRRVKIPNTCMP